LPFGKLFLVATPIGNLSDISERAVKTLREVAFIACEDTRRTRILLQHQGISREMVSLPAFDEAFRAKAIVDRILAGQDCALVTDAGTPGISDPGEKLVAEALARDIQVLPIPGPSAFVLALSAQTDLTQIKDLNTKLENAKIVQGDTYNALAASDAAIICSGTATVEAALLDVPMIVVYKVSKLTAMLAKPLIRTKFFGMVNLIAEREVAPELIQETFTAEKIAWEIETLLEPGRAAQARADLAEVRRRLGPPGAVERAAEAILALLPKAAKGSGNDS